MISARVLGFEVARVSGGEEIIACPFHDDRTPSAWFNPRKGLFYCAVCNLGLNIAQLSDRLHLDLELDWYEEDDNVEDYNLLTPNEPLELGTAQYHEYFIMRDICEQTIQRYEVRWKYSKPEGAALAITDYVGNTMGVVYRYLNPEETGTRYQIKGNLYPVWPMHLLQYSGENDLVIVSEGAFSAMRIDSYAYERMGVHIGSFALLGAKATQKIVDTLSSYKVVILYDNDNAGKNACTKMRRLAPHFHSYVLPKSPDDMDNAEVKKLITLINNKVSASYAR